MKRFRRFRASYIRQDEESGVGIVEYNSKHYDLHTLEIKSIYIDEKMSNRDLQIFIFKTLGDEIKESQRALLEMNQFSKSKNNHLPYNERIFFRQIEAYRGRLYQPYLLAQDALKRKTTITERFDETINFDIAKQERLERRRSNVKKNS